MKSWLKNFLMPGLWGSVMLVAILVSFLIVTLPFTVPIIAYSFNKINYYATLRKYGENANIQSIVLVGEGSNGTFVRDTDSYLFTSKDGVEIYKETEVLGNNDLKVFKNALTSTKKLEKIQMSNEDYTNILTGGNKYGV